jgi:lipoprotein NlpD
LKKTNLVTLAVLAAVAAGCATRRTPAPVVDARLPKALATKTLAAPLAPAAPAARSAEELYTVKRGDTLYSIALEHGVDYRDLAGLNGLDNPTRLRIGQQLKLKQAATAIAAAEPERPAVQVGTARIVGRVESRPLETLPPLPARTPPKSELARMQVVKPEPLKPVAVAAAPAAPVKSMSAPTPLGQFIWPAKGKLLAEFAEPRKKGIDIDGRPGDPIVAAASGRVTYIGSGIPGLGKLVVLNHDNGFITVYAHNRNILVKEQQTVARGQRIAELGSTDSERPKLHFQIRKGAAAVDPLLYLPR